MPTVRGERYDAFRYLEDTSPLRPLHREWAGEHVPPMPHAVQLVRRAADRLGPAG